MKYIVDLKKVFSMFLVLTVLFWSCIFTALPSASASPAETGTLFLKAAVHEDFYRIVCVTLKPQNTEKEFTLRVEGGKAFEVNIELPCGEYEVVSAYVENDDSYIVSYDKTKLAVEEDTPASIFLDVQIKSDTETESSNLVPTDETAEETSEVSSEQVDEEPAENSTPESSSYADGSSAETDEDEVERQEEVDDSFSPLKTLFNIFLSVAATVVFFVLFVLIVFFIRMKMDDN